MGRCGLVGIYLAAGKGIRMGRNKLNLPFAGQCLGSIAFRAALESKLDVTIAVTRQGDLLHWFAPFSKDKNWIIVECEDACKGQSASLKAGVNAALELGATGVVVLLADQPFVTSRMIDQLIDGFHEEEHRSYLSFSDKGVPKPPVLIASCLFPAILELSGDQGARALIRGAGSGRGKRIEVEDSGCFFDVDTKVDYQYLLENWQNLCNQGG
jgi:molybdenum cofactor cytidylyltransferase